MTLEIKDLKGVVSNERKRLIIYYQKVNLNYDNNDLQTTGWRL